MDVRDHMSEYGDGIDARRDLREARRAVAAHYWIPVRDREVLDAVHAHARRTAEWSGTVQRLHYHDPETECRDEVHEDVAA